MLEEPVVTRRTLVKRAASATPVVLAAITSPLAAASGLSCLVGVPVATRDRARLCSPSFNRRCAHGRPIP